MSENNTTPLITVASGPYAEQLAAANLTVASLAFEISDPLFMRSVTIAIAETAPDGTARDRAIAEGLIQRTKVGGEASLVIRRLIDNQVVFETRAKHDGRWSDDEAVLPAMFQAALQGFPNPPRGLRRVTIEIPR